MPRVLLTSSELTNPESPQRMALGLNIAGSAEPGFEDYTIRVLKLAGIHHVRMAWSVDAEPFTESLFRRLVNEEIRVMVTLLLPMQAAKKLADDADVQQQWRLFVRDFLKRFGGTVDTLEIGNAPNRPKWSGYTPLSYLAAWEIANEEAAQHGLSLAGPNISDFEPFFNIACLRSMRRSGSLPNVQTDNLFVERAIEPEAYDPSAMGRPLMNVARFNLAKKIRILADLGASMGVTRNYCTYTCWTRLRLARWTCQPERKGSDYLARYLLIAASTGRMERLYWGPLVDGRDGLIDCGDRDYPVIDNVAHYRSVRGKIENFWVSPAFWTLKFFTELVQTSDCVNVMSTPSGLYAFVFQSDENVHHIYFAPDRRVFDVSTLYPDDQVAAIVRNDRGRRKNHFNGLVGESPLALTWGTSSAPTVDRTAFGQLTPIGGTGVIHRLELAVEREPVELNSDTWRGVVSRPVNSGTGKVELLAPDNLNALPPVHKLRDKRNKLWVVESALHPQSLVIKLNRATGGRRLSYLFSQSKAIRHWNNANEMLRRGISTPAPVAFFERHTFKAVRANYYVSEYLPDSFSARDVFAAFTQGETSYRGIDKQTWIDAVAGCVAYMHRKRIIHRDLSAGNLLIQLQDGVPKVSVIDIGRAQLDTIDGAYKDLQRICFKLDWPDRETFIKSYQLAHPRGQTKHWRRACRAYDLKLTWKRRFRKHVLRRSKTVTSA